MWRRIRLRPRAHTPSPIATTPSAHAQTPRGSVDCTASNRGLFAGLLSLVIVASSLIAYFVLVGVTRLTANVVAVGAEALVHLLSVGAMLIAAWRVRDMCFTRKIDKSRKLEVALLLVAFAALATHCCTHLLAAVLTSPFSVHTHLLLARSSATLLQSVVQTVFICCCLHRSARTLTHAQSKPGREYVTFVLICNLALWAGAMVEPLRLARDELMTSIRAPDVIVWSVVTQLCLPLAIFFRFHSAVCLASVWSHMYKKNI